LGSKKAEDLVYIHYNLRLLSHKKEGYNEGVTKNWDLVPECSDLEATVAQLSHVSVYDQEATTSQDMASATAVGSNEVEDNEEEPNDDLDYNEDDEEEYGIGY
jgi:hypothetical protein